jgi:phosphatidylserine decarboxylase
MIFLTGLIVFILVIIGIQTYLRRVWFYRDPQREAPALENIVVSPADGQVVYIKEVKSQSVVCEKLGESIAVAEISKSSGLVEDGYLVGIYMSPLDVHYNYAPINGVIESIKHTQAKVNLPMVDLWEYIRITYFRKVMDLFNKKFHFQNERNTLFIKGDIAVAMVEIADKFVNKISCFVESGQTVKIGQKLAFIERGSQVDLFIPKESELFVEVGSQVFGGLTPIASYARTRQDSPYRG